MKYTIKYIPFLNQIEIANFLKSNSIEVGLDNGEINLYNFDNYFKAFTLAEKNNLISKDIVEKNFKDVYKEAYKIKTDKELEKEKYDISIDEKNVTMSCGEKYLSIDIIEEKEFEHYLITAEDKHIDKLGLDERKIKFLIKENTNLYDAVDRIYKNSVHKNTSNYIYGTLNDEQSNYLKIEKDIDSNNYKLIVVKKREDDINSTPKKATIDIGTPYDNDRWMSIDYLYYEMTNKAKKSKVYSKR